MVRLLAVGFTVCVFVGVLLAWATAPLLVPEAAEPADGGLVSVLAEDRLGATARFLRDPEQATAFDAQRLSTLSAMERERAAAADRAAERQLAWNEAVAERRAQNIRLVLILAAVLAAGYGVGRFGLAGLRLWAARPVVNVYPPRPPDLVAHAARLRARGHDVTWEAVGGEPMLADHTRRLYISADAEEVAPRRALPGSGA